jgi:hypothetical protein
MVKSGITYDYDAVNYKTLLGLVKDKGSVIYDGPYVTNVIWYREY